MLPDFRVLFKVLLTNTKLYQIATNLENGIPFGEEQTAQHYDTNYLGKNPTMDNGDGKKIVPELLRPITASI